MIAISLRDVKLIAAKERSKCSHCSLSISIIRVNSSVSNFRINSSSISMLRTWLLIPCTLVAFLAYDISKISVPEGALEPFNVRIFLYVQNFTCSG